MGKSLLDYLRNSGQLKNSSPGQAYMQDPVPSTDPRMDYLNYLQTNPNQGGMVSNSANYAPSSYSEISEDEPFSRGIRKALASARESVESRPKRRLAIDPEQKQRAFRRAIDSFSETYAQPTPDNIRPARGFWQRGAEVARGISAGMSTLDDETEKREALSREIDKENWKRDLEERKFAASEEKHRRALEDKYAQQQQKREEAEYKKALSERKLSLSERIAEHKLNKEAREEGKTKGGLKRVVEGARQLLNKHKGATQADISQRSYWGKESGFHPLSEEQKKLDTYGGQIKAASFKGARFQNQKEFDSIITVSSFYTPEVNKAILDAIEQTHGLLNQPNITEAQKSDIVDRYKEQAKAIVEGREQPSESSDKEVSDNKESGKVLMVDSKGNEFNIPLDKKEYLAQKYDLVEKGKNEQSK